MNTFACNSGLVTLWKFEIEIFSSAMNIDLTWNPFHHRRVMCSERFSDLLWLKIWLNSICFAFKFPSITWFHAWFFCFPKYFQSINKFEWMNCQRWWHLLIWCILFGMSGWISSPSMQPNCKTRKQNQRATQYSKEKTSQKLLLGNLDIWLMDDVRQAHLLAPPTIFCGLKSKFLEKGQRLPSSNEILFTNPSDFQPKMWNTWIFERKRAHLLELRNYNR